MKISVLLAIATAFVSFGACSDQSPEVETRNTEQGLTMSVQPYLKLDHEPHDMDDHAMIVTLTNYSEHPWIIEKPVVDYNLVLKVLDERGETPRERFRNINPYIDESFFLTLNKGEVYEVIVPMSEADYHFNDDESYSVTATYLTLYTDVYERNYGPVKGDAKLFREQVSSRPVRFEPGK